MTNTERLAEQNIREYVSRLRNLDEKPVHQHVKSSILSSFTGSKYRQRQNALYLQELRFHSLDNWQREEIAMAGPMEIWDAIALQLERLVEKLEH